MFEEILLWIITGFGIFVIFYFLLLNSTYLWLLILGAKEMIYFKRKTDMNICDEEECELAPTISILVPTYNEEKIIMNTVNALRKLEYPELEMILINDGSEDSTLELLSEKLRLVKILRKGKETLNTENVKGTYKSLKDDRILVIDKENGGKADALNAGLNYSNSDLFISIDGDTLIEKDSLRKLVQNYLDIDENIIAIGGIVRVANNCLIEDAEVKKARLPKKILPSIQVVEYIRAFLFGRSGLSNIDSLPLISGAFGLFKTEPVIETGGFRTDTVGEDMDLVVRLHKHMKEKGKDHNITFVPDPVCWTIVPDNLSDLKAQRSRWQRGLIESLTYGPRMILNPKYGRIGLIGIPLFFFFEMLGPIIEISGIFFFLIAFSMGLVSLPFTLLFISVSLVFGLIISIFSLILDEYSSKRYNTLKDKAKLVLLAALENFGYRQIRSVFRLFGVIDLLRKNDDWGSIEKSYK